MTNVRSILRLYRSVTTAWKDRIISETEQSGSLEIACLVLFESLRLFGRCRVRRAAFPPHLPAHPPSLPDGCTLGGWAGRWGGKAEPSGQNNNPKPTKRMQSIPFVGLVATARGKHPIPSRTRPLSPVAPMVLRLKTWESRSPPDQNEQTSVVRYQNGPKLAIQPKSPQFSLFKPKTRHQTHTKLISDT